MRMNAVIIMGNLRAPNKMNLHSNGLFCIWSASGCITHPRMGYFAFLAKSKNAHSRCNAHFVRGSKYIGPFPGMVCRESMKHKRALSLRSRKQRTTRQRSGRQPRTVARRRWLIISLGVGITVLAWLVGVWQNNSKDTRTSILAPTVPPSEESQVSILTPAEVGILSAPPSELTSQERERWLRKEQLQVTQQLSHVFPKNANAAFLVAMAQNAQGNSDAAIAQLKRTLQLQPTHIDACEQLGFFTHSQGEFDQSLQAMRRLVELAPRRLGIHLHIAETLIEQGQLDAAIKALQREIVLNPHSGRAYRVLGNAYLQQQSYEEAQIFLEKAITYEPNEAKAYYSLATVLARLKQTDRAQAYRQQFKKLENANQEAQRRIRMDLDTLHEVATSVAHTHTDVGRVYAVSGQAGPAELLWKRAAQLDPNDLRCRLELAGLYHQAQRPEQALQWCREALTQDPGNGQANYLIGNLQLACRRFDQAEAAFSKVIELSPQRPEGYQSLAALYMAEKPDLPKAIHMAQQAVRVTSTAQNFALLAEAQWRSHNLAQAKAAVQQALKRAPFDPHIQALHRKITGNP